MASVFGGLAAGMGQDIIGQKNIAPRTVAGPLGVEATVEGTGQEGSGLEGFWRGKDSWVAKNLGGPYTGFEPAPDQVISALSGPPNKPKVVPASDPVKKVVAADAAETAAEKPKGTTKPAPVVTAKGLLADDETAAASGGAQMLTTPFGVVGDPKVKKQTLLGA